MVTPAKHFPVACATDAFALRQDNETLFQIFIIVCRKREKILVALRPKLLFVSIDKRLILSSSYLIVKVKKMNKRRISTYIVSSVGLY